MQLKEKIISYLNYKFQVRQVPNKRPIKLYILSYLASHFEDKEYKETEVNDVIDDYLETRDHATLRRELFTHYYINRSIDGRTYYIEEKLVFTKLLDEFYHLSLSECNKVDANTFDIQADMGSYTLKLVDETTSLDNVVLTTDGKQVSLDLRNRRCVLIKQ